MSELARRMPELAGLRVLIVGLGRSGLAAARLAAERGARVLAVDRKSEAELGTTASDLRAAGIELRAGGHAAELADEADLVVVSPGVPGNVEPLVAAQRRGVPVWGEVELAARFCRGKVIGITGSNGKSTTTAMIGHVLRRAGIPGGTGGNLYTPFCELLADDGPEAVHAVELSSFQLETALTLEADPALLLNVSPDHMDRYEHVDDYAAAKARLLDLQAGDAYAVLNADDPPSRVFDPHVRGRRLLFSTRERLDRGAFLRGQTLVLRTDDGEDQLCEVGQLPLRGEHNTANTLAAALACRLAGRSPEEIVDGVLSFKALPHRLQHVATIDGVDFYNDSKATNPASTMRALTAFEPGTVHLILGGREKGTDWHDLDWPIRRFAKRLLLVGEATPKIRRAFLGVVPLVECATVPQAVRVGYADAQEGDVVLLAPACASFDQYRNFEERGEDFCKVVRALQMGEGGDA